MRATVSVRMLLRGLLVGVVALTVAGVPGFAQQQQAVCVLGEGHFEAHLRDGAGVTVGPVATGQGFSGRACSAAITWKGGTVLQVATAGQIDIDVMGADLGFGVPVVAFEIRKASTDWRATYAIYSLDKAPRLLAQLTGGDVYRAVDADFNGRIAIWTSDAAAVNGFDGLRYADFDFPPTVVLRYENRKLEDVSAEYPRQYDKQIAQVGAQLTPQALAAFRNSDGKLEDGYRPWPELIALRKTKAKVLEIVWSYLYSGREARAWEELAQMWPAADLGRVKAALIATRARGFDALAADVRGPLERLHHWRVAVYDTTATSRQILPLNSMDGSQTRLPDPLDTTEVFNRLVDTDPQPIAMMRTELVRQPEVVVLVVDAAGKVWSAKMAGSENDPELLEAAKGWKFIPAFKGTHAVACRTKMDIWPLQ
ncbi:MAG TPA: energy transducer TonB [Acidobacteriaceae bacterium]|nr:energy transducer TonB [Acidobacteriaceae bacterium]